MSELIYRIFDMGKVESTIKNALTECEKLKNRDVSESELNIELNSIIFQLTTELENCIKIK
jgi:hypothetical protein